MNKLEHIMTEYQPLSEPLTEKEIKELKQRVLEKSRTKRKPYRLMLTLAAAMCLLAACGAAAIGLFDSMADTNQTTEMVEKYSLALENPPSTTVDGHTVTVQAVIRSDTIARVVYDISGSKRQVNDWMSFRDSKNRVMLRIQMRTNGQPSGHADTLPDHENQIRQIAPIGAVSDNHSVRCFADLDLTDGADTVSVYVLSEDGGAEVLQAALPEPIEEKELILSDTTLGCHIREIRLTPFRLILEGTWEGTGQETPIDTDWSELVHLYDADGKEIYIGKDGSFFSASGHTGDTDFSIELDSYDLMDPADAAGIEIDGVRYPFD